ncbi:hypothetical protein PsorP6_007076 [Peronosclerospora sorghi]|uniref:Uncharacterized protein n=1 Tax=Peronosclerospora sorghi TaxID=230839 RepID=A0ACC0W6L9_9STRA|nr:hypothetical protein PsorP6_019011 [Peronosclerospora sorghi]KAI9914280.1 hypothetical protein PsorP6_007076 [Peronosclerospora sorghi]
MNEEDLYVPNSLLKRRSHFVLYTDLYDGHVSVFSHWVLNLLQEKNYIASTKADLVPHLVRRQLRGANALPESELAASMSLSEKKHDPEDVVVYAALPMCCLQKNAYCERADTIPAYRAMDKEVGSRLRIKHSGSMSN